MQVNAIESSNDDWGVAVRRIQKIAREDYSLNRWLLSAHLARYCLVIASAIVISEVLQNPFIYIVAVMLIGAHQLGLGHICYHERTHGLISPDPVWNDRIGAILIHLVGVNIIMGYENFWPRHLTHHRYVNRALDPDAWAPLAIKRTSSGGMVYFFSV